MTTSGDVHQLLGAYVLGGLSDEDHRAFTEHLRTCAACQQELGQVSGLPRLLSLVDGTSAEVPHVAGLVPDAPGLGREPGSEAGLAVLLSAARQRRKRRRGWLVAAASAAAVVVFGAGAWLGPGLLDSPPPSEHYTATAVAGSSAKVGVDLITRGWGTQLELACSNMPVGEEIVVYVVDASGRQLAAGSWLGTASGYARVTGATALRPSEIRAVEVRTADGTVIAAART